MKTGTKSDQGQYINRHRLTPACTTKTYSILKYYSTVRSKQPLGKVFPEAIGLQPLSETLLVTICLTTPSSGKTLPPLKPGVSWVWTMLFDQGRLCCQICVTCCCLFASMPVLSSRYPEDILHHFCTGSRLFLCFVWPDKEQVVRVAADLTSFWSELLINWLTAVLQHLQCMMSEAIEEEVALLKLLLKSLYSVQVDDCVSSLPESIEVEKI